MTPLVESMFEYVQKAQPRSLTGIEEARATNPSRFDGYADLYLGWAQGVLGDIAIPRTIDAFVEFTTGVNLAQGRYEATGAYENKTYAECYASVYNEPDAMGDYLWGVYVTNFLWAHHLEISMFFEDRFLPRIGGDRTIIEIAPGHGGWGLLALTRVPEATLSGFDISPSSIDIAGSLARASGLAPRAAYELRDALDLETVPAQSADAVICNFLIEHLENPRQLLKVIHHLLRPGRTAFLSGALTAAQVDHIYEMRRESELVEVAEEHGLRVRETLSVNPRRTLPRARFLPRSMSLILERPEKPLW